MKEKEQYNKNAIINRMFSNAQDIWGMVSNDNFDPLITLLMEALACELDKVMAETNQIETRLVERVAELLTPDAYKNTQPSHAILHAQPLENGLRTNKKTVFSHDRFTSQSLKFSPAGCFRSYNASVKYLITNGNIYEITPGRTRSLKINNNHFPTPQGVIRIGIQTAPETTQMENISFFFDILHKNKYELFQLLPYTQWELEDKKLSIHKGIYREEETNSPDREVVNYYNHQFITVTDELDTSIHQKKRIPEELASLFPEEMIQQLEPVIWLKVTFPPNFNEYIFENLSVTINAFPVVNKQLRMSTFKPALLSSIYPIITEDETLFHSIESVTDTQGNQYTELPFRQPGHKNDATYIIKRGGAERFDSRSARIFISNLIDIIQEESASFATLGRGFLGEYLGKIHEQFLAIEQKIDSVDAIMDMSSYLVIDSPEINEKIFVEYWSTYGEKGNRIKAGSSFVSTQGNYLQATLVLLTPTTGGKSHYKMRSTDIYKYLLTSRDRIFTEEDICNFCQATFGELILKSEVKKGYRISPLPQEGMIRTLDVYLTLKQKISDSNTDIEEKLLYLLNEKSPESFNYRVFIKNE